jgi:drug/metabolite transporter (DMT)-like permease
MYFILGLLDLLYLIPYYKSLKNIDTSIVVALFALGRIIIPILGYILLDEKLRHTQYFGFFIIILSSILLSSQKIKSLKINKAFCLMILSSLIHSIFLVLEKYTINKDTTWINMMIYPLIFSSIIPFALFISHNIKKEILQNFINFKKNISLFLIMELFSFIGLLTITFILPHISSIAKVSISSSTPIFVLIFGLLLKKYKQLNYIENITPYELRKKLFFFLLIGYGTFLVIK